MNAIFETIANIPPILLVTIAITLVLIFLLLRRNSKADDRARDDRARAPCDGPQSHPHRGGKRWRGGRG